MQELDLTQRVVRLEESRTVVNRDRLVVRWILEDELDALFLVGVVVGMVSNAAQYEYLSTMNG